jgi:hypothetical protein
MARGRPMTRLRLVKGSRHKRVLVYGMRLFDGGTLDKVGRGEVVTTDGRSTRITLHVIEGSIDQIKKQLAASVDAFFELHGEMK